jgi:cell wall assembly regulator SMI1
MSIESDWRAIEAELAQRSPQILADLRPPKTEAEAANWSAAAGELPTPLRELYSVHAGTATRGAGGFCFIGNWYPLTVDQALVRYERCRRMADLWARDPLIPFAFDPTGSHLGVRPGDGGDLSIIFDDTPDMPYETYPDIETLTAETVEGLRGNSADYRTELTEQYLSWINLEEEADDLGY